MMYSRSAVAMATRYRVVQLERPHFPPLRITIPSKLTVREKGIRAGELVS